MATTARIEVDLVSVRGQDMTPGTIFVSGDAELCRLEQIEKRPNSKGEYFWLVTTVKNQLQWYSLDYRFQCPILY